MLQGVGKLQSETGATHVYDYPITAPGGYPYAVVTADGLSSEISDTFRDVRTYRFLIQIVGEKFGGDTELTQQKAMQTMRNIEDDVLSTFDNNNDLDVSGVIRSLPTQVDWGTSDGGSRLVLTINLDVQASVNITQ